MLCVAVLLKVVDDAGGVAVLKPSGGSSSAKSGGAVQLINEAAVQAELGVAPEQVRRLSQAPLKQLQCTMDKRPLV